MSTLHSPLGIVSRSLSSITLSHDHRNNHQSHSQTKSQSPKQKDYALFLPLSPALLLRKRRGTLPAYEHKSSGAENRAGAFSFIPKAREWSHLSPNSMVEMGMGALASPICANHNHSAPRSPLTGFLSGETVKPQFTAKPASVSRGNEG